MTSFGSGFELDNNLDLVVSPAGDISMVDGPAELKKDLAYKLTQTLDSQVGDTLTFDHRQNLRATIKGVLKEDPRVEAVIDITITPTSGTTDSLSIKLEATTAAGPFEQVVAV